MIRRIFLDIDDVLNRLTMTVLRHWGCPVAVEDYSAYPHWLGYDVIGAASALYPYPGVRFTDNDWLRLPRWLWAEVKPSADCYWLIDRCAELVGQENVCLLSAATASPECLAGKLEWIHDRLPTFLHKQYLIGQPKRFCAHPEALLIDDRDSNVSEFRIYGGNALLVPRPWNSLSHLDTRAHLEHALTTIEPVCGAAA